MEGGRGGRWWEKYGAIVIRSLALRTRSPLNRACAIRSRYIPPSAGFTPFSRKNLANFLVPILPNSMYLSPSTRNGEQCENVTKPIVKSSGGRRMEITRRGSRSMRGDQGAIGCHFITENIGPTTVHSQGPFLEIRRNSVVSVSAQPVFSLSNGTHLTA